MQPDRFISTPDDGQNADSGAATIPSTHGEPNLATGGKPSPAARWVSRLTAGLIALIIFAAVAPTLNWAGFFNSMENINIETALEMRRDGHRTIPTLQGSPRIAKPPLTAWLTALTVRARTVKDMSSRNPATRMAAFSMFNAEVRWFALLSCCASLVATFELGRMVAGTRVGLVSTLICGSTFLFLRFARLSLTDVQLTLWVSFANMFLAKAILENRRWLGCIGAGICLGLALMSKGPVAIIETALPFAAFAIMASFAAKKRTGMKSSAVMARDSRTTSWTGPILVGVALALLIEVPWYLCVLKQLGGQWDAWRVEISGNEDPTKRADAWYSYLLFLLTQFVPWIVFIIGGGIAIIAESARGKVSRLLLPVLLILLPIIVMNFFKLKKDRYLLPMTGPAAIVAAVALLAIRRPHLLYGSDSNTTSTENSTPTPESSGESAFDSRSIDRAVPKPNLGGMVSTWLHWIILSLIVLGTLEAGRMGWSPAMKTASGHAVFSNGLVVAMGAGLAAIIGAGIILGRRTDIATVISTAITMLALQTIAMAAFGRSVAGENRYHPLAERVLTAYPDADVVVSTEKINGPIEFWMYFQRTIPVESKASLEHEQPGNHPKVALVSWNAISQKQKPAIPNGWKYFDALDHGEDSWAVFVLPATAK